MAAPWVRHAEDFASWLDRALDRSCAVWIPDPIPLQEIPLASDDGVETTLVWLDRMVLEFPGGTELYVTIVATEYQEQTDTGVIRDFVVDRYRFHYQRVGGGLIWRYDFDEIHADDPAVGRSHYHDANDDRHPCPLVDLDRVLDLIHEIET